MLISTAYLPPVWYVARLAACSTAVVESREHFVKQTIRNRCHILSPNGIQALIVPVVHKNRERTPIKDIRISYEIPWQRQHWRSLRAAYQRSAYFEFYQDEMAPYYERNFDFLFDFNLELLDFLMRQLSHNITLSITRDYQLPDGSRQNDYRASCNTGTTAVTGNEMRYPQVFSYKSGFVPGLSMVDLLFSMGPASKIYLPVYGGVS